MSVIGPFVLRHDHHEEAQANKREAGAGEDEQRYADGRNAQAGDTSAQMKRALRRGCRGIDGGKGVLRSIALGVCACACRCASASALRSLGVPTRVRLRGLRSGACVGAGASGVASGESAFEGFDASRRNVSAGRGRAPFIYKIYGDGGFGAVVVDDVCFCVDGAHDVPFRLRGRRFVETRCRGASLRRFGISERWASDRIRCESGLTRSTFPARLLSHTARRNMSTSINRWQSVMPPSTNRQVA